MTSSTKAKFSLGRISLLDVTVWTVAVLLTGTLAVLVGMSDPARQGDRVAYLSPAYGDTQNIWLTSLNNPAQAVQLTQEQGGIYNFDVSADGRFIVYSARDAGTGLNNLFMLDLQTRRSQQLTTCSTENADCRTPAIKPDGKMIAYERMGYSSNSSGGLGGPGAIRIWLLDISQQPYTTRPLTDDAQFVGHSPSGPEVVRPWPFTAPISRTPVLFSTPFSHRTGKKP